ncbi:MAG: ATP-binding protein [Paludibacteraceae bacterium]|nr:ATP-binding protein [Paludibacteraceae bacterium]
METKLTDIRKKDIQSALADYCARYGGQSKAAKILDGVSSGTISQMVNGNWENISDEMWRKVASQIGLEADKWNAVETQNYQRLMQILADAKENQLWMAITGSAGSGKTFACKQYSRDHQAVFYVSCDPDWTKREFFSVMLRKIGKEPSGLTLIQMKQKLVLQMRCLNAPIIILDEADKLSDVVLNSFITLYNDLQYDCGVVMIATEFLFKRFDAGVRFNKKGFNELWSRIGRKCVPLRGVTQQDIVEICRANGVDDTKEIDRIINDCEGDLRRVQRRVHAYLKKQQS